MTRRKRITLDMRQFSPPKVTIDVRGHVTARYAQATIIMTGCDLDWLRVAVRDKAIEIRGRMQSAIDCAGGEKP